MNDHSTHTPGDPHRTGHPDRSVRHGASRALACIWWATVALAPMAAPPAVAATVWRCGNAYSNAPCANGQRIDTGDAPSETARRAADEATRRIEHRADAMERERLRAEQVASTRNGAVILPDHRVAEAQAREASRRSAERAAREEERRRNRLSGRRTGGGTTRIGHAGARADGQRHR